MLAPDQTQAADAVHLTRALLDAGLEEVLRAPSAEGAVELIVRRPAVDEREVLAEAELDLVAGLVGDTWSLRGSKRTADGSSHPAMQLTVMSARVVDLVAGGDRERWPLAGDQLYVDLDLSVANLPTGSRLAVGESAVVEVTKYPHAGCAKFVEHYGEEATRFVNTDEGRALRLRGMNGIVVTPGTVRPGDPVRVLSRGEPPMSVSLP
jgi:hypothetical protein